MFLWNLEEIKCSNCETQLNAAVKQRPVWTVWVSLLAACKWKHKHCGHLRFWDLSVYIFNYHAIFYKWGMFYKDTPIKLTHRIHLSYCHLTNDVHCLYLKLAALPLLMFFNLLKMRKDLSPYPSACQHKSSQEVISTVLVSNNLHTCSLPFSSLRVSQELMLINLGHAIDRGILYFACLKKVCSLSLTRTTYHCVPRCYGHVLDPFFFFVY